jgi:hypothetical protein
VKNERQGARPTGKGSSDLESPIELYAPGSKGLGVRGRWDLLQVIGGCLQFGCQGATVPAPPRHLCARCLLPQLCVPVGYGEPSVKAGLVLRLYNQQAAGPQVLCRALSTCMCIYNVQSVSRPSMDCVMGCSIRTMWQGWRGVDVSRGVVRRDQTCIGQGDQV